MSTKLSVVIPVYKKTDMFVQNLQHNIAFSPKNIEIIIVDDASQEYLSEKIESLLKKKNVHLIETDEEVLAREEREIKRKEERRLQYEKLRKEFEG
jgi:glycosyltransferase involved in cell wall biosynthesis